MLIIDAEKAAKVSAVDDFFTKRESARKTQMIANLRRSELTDKAATMHVGKMMASGEFCRKLASLNRALIFEQSRAYPDRGGIYVQDGVSNMDDLDLTVRGRRFVTGFPWGMMPENSIPNVTVDDKGETHVKSIAKGWRDTLKVLIQMRLITLSSAERVFGSGGENWHQKLH